MKTMKRRWLAVSLIMALALSAAVPSGSQAYAAEVGIGAAEAAATENEAAPEAAAENEAAPETAAENDTASEVSAEDAIVSAAAAENEEDVNLDASGTELISLEEEAGMELDQYSYYYTGESIMPAVEVRLLDTDSTLLKNTVDYTLTYKNNLNIGTATVTVTGKGSYTGTLTETFTIEKGVTDIQATAANTNLKIGETVQISVNKNFTGYTYTVEDTSENDGEEVISVDANGLVTALHDGRAVVAIELPESDLTYGGYDTIEFFVGENTYKTATVGGTLTQTYYGDHVTYQMTPSKSYYYNFHSTSAASDWVSMGIYDHSTGEETAYTSITETDTYDFDLNCWMKAGTTYDIKIKNESMTGEEAGSFSVKIGYSTIKLLSATPLSNGVKVTWERLANTSQEAGYYYVYRKPASGTSNWKCIGKNVYPYYEDKTAVSGTAYLYTVRASCYLADNAVATDFDTAGVTGYWLAGCGAPSVGNLATGIKVTWTKVTGAQGYIVYRKTTGNWSAVGVIKSGSTVTWTDTKVSNGTAYYYTVRPYITVNGTVYRGAFASSKAQIWLIPSTVTSLTNTKTRKMTAVWSRNSGATGYQLQYSLYSSFAGAVTLKITPYTVGYRAITNLKKSKTYYVRVRSYKTASSVTCYSAWSAAKKVKISK